MPVDATRHASQLGDRAWRDLITSHHSIVRRELDRQIDTAGDGFFAAFDGPARAAKRPLGISTIRDRVAQTAAVLVLSPIFEADLQPEQYAYRQGRSAHDAVRHIHRLLNTGYRDVVDASPTTLAAFRFRN
jgi:class 3 adenylate cyclase